ncbi:uncharacterized protein LOC111711695 [Eurytemora carolleeae]|uniref:uncharacterized protein LOC111711695 n=1 Tax=Eurytemora carolleeae TaxID=1294199 RepID=UPI000C7934EC|nr:uncharacterized protein LOC111711695 [Eurytemora carolleeae]|eukprot:XP_023341868.1 uncharacterized protein LOC111711695 [Eurytemora affinis]
MGDNLGLDRFSILITVCSPVLLAGVGVYLPIRSCESGLRVSVDLIEHGTASSGPAGDMVASRSLYISRSSLATWPHKFRGAKLVQIEAEGDQCKEDPGRGLHPLPVMFDQLVELQTSIRYMLTLCLDKENEDHQESETLGSVWGFQGPPPSRKIEEEENYFRWFQVKRPGSTSSGSNKQFPIIYYLS